LAMQTAVSYLISCNMKKLLIGIVLFLALLGLWRMTLAMNGGMGMGMGMGSSAGESVDQAFVDSAGEYFLDSDGKHLVGATP
jgi:hypothetical protein